jgi:hypothetical protein
MMAHRMAWYLHTGDMPAAHTVIRHKCDTPLCVEPGHLEPGSQTDNMQDMWERGRSNYLGGGRHGMAKITDEMVRFMRGSGLRNKQLVKISGLSKAQVSKIMLGQSWFIGSQRYSLISQETARE